MLYVYVQNVFYVYIYNVFLKRWSKQIADMLAPPRKTSTICVIADVHHMRAKQTHQSAAKPVYFKRYS